MQEEDEYLQRIQKSPKRVIGGTYSKSSKGEQREAYGGIP